MILEEIVQNPSGYKSIIRLASFEDLKKVYIFYIGHYTTNDVNIMVQFYSESELRDKLLGCSQAVISTIMKYFNMEA